MNGATAEQLPGFVNIKIHDWEGTRCVELEGVPRNATFAELVDEARRQLGLSIDTEFQAVRDGFKVNHMQTLEEAGIDSDTDLEIHPEVSAG
jgi:hypothetical protein